MTYGWMILLVVVVVVIIFSLGIFSPSSFVSPSSTISSFAGVKVTSVIANYTYIEFSLSNALLYVHLLNQRSKVHQSLSHNSIVCEIR